MIELAPDRLPALTRWLPAGAPGPAVVGEHVLGTGIGHWWADRPDQPHALAVSCAGYAVLRGAPDTLTPEALAPLAHHYIDAPVRFLPALRSAFDRLTPWERMVWTLQAEPHPSPTPRGVTIRRLEPRDAHLMAALDPDAAWIHGTWGGPAGLASSGHGRAAVDRGGELLAVACTHFRGTRYEDVSVFTRPDHRRHHLGLACVTALCADITARGHQPSWNCSALNRASRLLAWTAGFRLVREYVHHAAGSPTWHSRRTAESRPSGETAAARKAL
ncbi:GNAT family N-acetyltransferase [Streptomyces chiangmaiensis]|uniref:GNAT family N-acetyltransferase n=1 Tax=Streptomyces chiangmaiensis TaxID=766497 RepID=A0ABU7FQZ6_9ACTN|nr:GNAT family N-acetyltransferase [Streptomyces chiangmaiensis]MED7826535.1 GNAT family N-acetyltransferase [Streptomyces chiangmaiensis]